jgi:hypothetical protein
MAHSGLFSPVLASMLIFACLVAASVASSCPLGTGTWAAMIGRDEIEVSFGQQANATLVWVSNTIPWCGGTTTSLSGGFQMKGTSGTTFLFHLLLNRSFMFSGLILLQT